MKTSDHLKALLQDRHVLEAVVGSLESGNFDWRRGDSIETLVSNIVKARCVRKAHRVACVAYGALAAVRALTWPAQARALRHAMYCEGALIPKRRQTSEDRQRASAKAWGFDS